MLGLFAFFYACLHFSTYLVLDQFFDWDEIVRDVAKRPYITVGFTAFVLLIPLAVTSTNKMVQRLGNSWRRLHSPDLPLLRSWSSSTTCGWSRRISCPR